MLIPFSSFSHFLVSLSNGSAFPYSQLKEIRNAENLSTYNPKVRGEMNKESAVPGSPEHLLGSFCASTRTFLERPAPPGSASAPAVMSASPLLGKNKKIVPRALF